MDLNVLGHGLTISQLKTQDPRRRNYSKSSIDSLRHPFLDSLPEFQDLLSHLSAFYQAKGESSTANPRWKEVLHNSLHSLLTELVFTNDKLLQLKLLSNISQWYYSKIFPVKSRTPQTSKAAEKKPILPQMTTGSSLNSTATSRFKRTTSTPQPKHSETLRPSYQAYVRSNKPEDPLMESKLESIFAGMQARQQKRIHLGRYKESKRNVGKIEEWGNFKAQRLENLNHRHEITSYRLNTSEETKHPRFNVSMIDFTEDNEENQENEGEEQRYKMFSRPGMVRSFCQNVIDVEEVPEKKVYAKERIELPRHIDSEQIQELFDVKSKLAKRGIKSNLKELEFGIFNRDYKELSPQKLPVGGESLINNPLISLKSKSDKKKKKKGRKKKN